MHIDQYGQQIRSESDLIDLLMRGSCLNSAHPFLVDSELNLDSVRYFVDQMPKVVTAENAEISVAEFDHRNHQQWLMPEHYGQLNIIEYVLDLCSNEAELQRCGEELLLFAERGLLEMLKYLVYLVDTMRANHIIWGVGRGSSVASFVLFKLGVHRINSLFYDLDIREFLR